MMHTKPRRPDPACGALFCSFDRRCLSLPSDQRRQSESSLRGRSSPGLSDVADAAIVAMIKAAAAKIGSMNRRVLSEMSNMMEVLSIAEVGGPQVSDRTPCGKLPTLRKKPAICEKPCWFFTQIAGFLDQRTGRNWPVSQFLLSNRSLDRRCSEHQSLGERRGRECLVQRRSGTSGQRGGDSAQLDRLAL